MAVRWFAEVTVFALYLSGMVFFTVATFVALWLWLEGKVAR